MSKWHSQRNHGAAATPLFTTPISPVNPLDLLASSRGANTEWSLDYGARPAEPQPMERAPTAKTELRGRSFTAVLYSQPTHPFSKAMRHATIDAALPTAAWSNLSDCCSCSGSTNHSKASPTAHSASSPGDGEIWRRRCLHECIVHGRVTPDVGGGLLERIQGQHPLIEREVAMAMSACRSGIYASSPLPTCTRSSSFRSISSFVSRSYFRNSVSM